MGEITVITVFTVILIVTVTTVISSEKIAGNHY